MPCSSLRCAQQTDQVNSNSTKWYLSMHNETCPFENRSDW